MAINDVLAYAKENDVAISAVLLHPAYNESKGRVTKGNAVPHYGWNAKKRWELKNTKKIHNKLAEAWIMDLTKMGLYVVDIDVKGDKKAVDVLKKEVYDNILHASHYIVETGSGGIHAYFKRPTLDEGSLISKSIGNPYFKQWFVNADDGDVDIIVDAIITEGTFYDFESKRYTYTSIKAGGSIFGIEESEEMWEEVSPFILTTPQQLAEQQRKREEADLSRPVELQEVIDHFNNIPNNRTNWGDWYKMAQIAYNVLGDSGYDVFVTWSSQNKDHSDRVARDLWRGLSERTGGRTLTIGTLMYLSKQASEDNYKRIRAKYSPLSYASMKVLIEEDHFYVEEPNPLFVRVRERDAITYTSSEFCGVVKPMECPYTNEKGITKTKPFFDIWTSDPYRRVYKRFGFYPDNSKCPKDEYNRFVPAEASFIQEEREIDLQPILAHFELMGNHEKDNVEFLLNFFAQIVQQPDVIPGMAVLLYAKEGAGKDILVDWIGNKVLGRHQYRKAGSIKNVFKGFNAHLLGKLLIHCDEIDNRTMKENYEDFKRLVTATEIDIEAKNKDVQAYNSYTRYFLTTNNRDAFMGVLTATGRREVLIESSSEKITDRDYFVRLVEFLKTPGVERTFYNYLMKRDISAFHHTNRPKTALYKEIQQASINPILQWIVESNDSFDEEQQRTTQWLALYNMWAEQNHMKRHNVTSFGLFMNEMIGKSCGITKQAPKNVSKLTIVRPEVMKWLVAQKLIDEVEEE